MIDKEGLIRFVRHMYENISWSNISKQNITVNLRETEKELNEAPEFEKRDDSYTSDTQKDEHYYINLLVSSALSIRHAGSLSYFLAKGVAIAFLQDSEGQMYVNEISLYAKEVGIKYALKRFTKLDREVDLIQLISEHYNDIILGKGQKRSLEQINRIKQIYKASYLAEVNYHGCSQCVLMGLFETVGNADPNLFKAATSLSGGIAQCGDGPCGGYSGGVLYMGTFMGRSWEYRDNDKINQYRSFDMAQKLHDKYVETYGSVIGSNIHEKVFGEFYLLRDQVQKKAFGNAGAHEYICPCIVGTAARWVAEILMDEKLI